MKAFLVLALLASSLSAFAQGDHPNSAPAPASPSAQAGSALPDSHTDELKQELDADAIALSKIPADPLIQPDLLTPFLRPFDKVASKAAESVGLKSNITYTFLNQYATITPDSVRHDQFSGRLDFTGAWNVYEHGSTAGSISLLVRSGTNIGISQRFNLSDRLGSPQPSSARGCRSSSEWCGDHKGLQYVQHPS